MRPECVDGCARRLLPCALIRLSVPSPLRYFPERPGLSRAGCACQLPALIHRAKPIPADRARRIMPVPVQGHRRPSPFPVNGCRPAEGPVRLSPVDARVGPSIVKNRNPGTGPPGRQRARAVHSCRRAQRLARPWRARLWRAGPWRQAPSVSACRHTKAQHRHAVCQRPGGDGVGPGWGVAPPGRGGRRRLSVLGRGVAAGAVRA
jgi:hypothetical protein